MSFVPAILYHLGVKTSISIKGETQNPQSMDELLKNYSFERPTPMFTWAEYCVKRDEIERQRGMAYIRKHRASELSQTDWVETEINKTTLENLPEWLAYRQTLRDLPTLITKVVWNFQGSIPKLDFQAMNIPVRPQTIRKK
jgi:hypothetical protein